MPPQTAVSSLPNTANQWLGRVAFPREFTQVLSALELDGSRDLRHPPILAPRGEREARRNQLLTALPDDVLAAMHPHLERIRLEQRDLLFGPGEAIEFVYFPETAVGSLVGILSGGGVSEVATVGCEGIIGLPIFLGEQTSSHHAFTQVPGYAERMTVASFAVMVKSSPDLQLLLLRYTQAFLTQVTQTAACNVTHLVEERCARWLLATHDRVIGDELELTHELLAFTLGVRRAGVTVVMNSLRTAGLISYSRGRVVVRDRAGLEAASCACYDVVRLEHTCRSRPEVDA